MLLNFGRVNVNISFKDFIVGKMQHSTAIVWIKKCFFDSGPKNLEAKGVGVGSVVGAEGFDVAGFVLVIMA